jgi:hypothetical protein
VKWDKREPKGATFIVQRTAEKTAPVIADAVEREA